MSRLPFLALGVGTLILAGCSNEQWVHRYKKQDQFTYDYNKCDRQVVEQSNSGRVVTYTPYVQRSMVDQCLMKEGWRQVEKRD